MLSTRKEKGKRGLCGHQHGAVMVFDCAGVTAAWTEVPQVWQRGTWIALGTGMAVPGRRWCRRSESC